MKTATKLKGYIFTVLSAVIYGTMPLMARYIYADGVNALTLVFLRNLLALPSLAFMVWLTEKSFKIERGMFFKVSLPSVLGCAVTPVLLFASYNYLASGTSTVFHFIYPALVVLIGIVFLKKKAVFGTLLSLALCFIGVFMFYDSSQAFSFAGAGLALGSGVTFALYVISLSYFNKKGISGFSFSFYMTLWSSIIMLVFCLVTDTLMLPSSPAGWGLCLLFSFLVTTCAVVLFQQGTFILGGEKAAILSTLEPITSVLIGIFIFREAVTVKTVIGCILVISASILIALSDIKNKNGGQKNA